MSETIYFNGKKYNNVSDMPFNVRQMYEKLNRFMEDQDQDGVPDLIQSGGLSGIKETVNMIKDIAQFSSPEGFNAEQISLIRVSDSNIFINGKEFASVAEMPNHVRQEYERIINASQDEVEDIFEESWRQVNREEFFVPHDDEILNQQISNQIPNAEASIQTVDSTNRFLMIVTVSILILGCMVAVWFLIF